MTAFLFRLCLIHHLSLRTPHDYRHLTPAHPRAKAARQRHRKAARPCSIRFHRRKLSVFIPAHRLPAPITRLHFPTPCDATSMADSRQELRRRCSSAADRLGPNPNVDAMATTTTFAPAPDTRPLKPPKSDEAAPATMMPPPSSTEVGSAPPNSGLCRSANRLSLTLPIATQTADRARPPPTTAASYSIPPTPVETPTIPPLADANEFIIAIAAQERRVLELREDLARAEADLASLKRQWTDTGSFFKPGVIHHAEMPGNSVPGALDDDAIGPRRSADLDRRKLLYQTQSQNQGTPTQGNRRRLFRGGHTRTLSLLSPARSNSEFETHGLGIPDPTSAQLANPALLKRASWQPRSVQNSPIVPQIVEDFKLGLRAFVEDIRHITIGDEHVSSPSPARSPSALQQSSAANRGPGGGLGRSRMGFTPIGPSSSVSTPTPASRFGAPGFEKTKTVKAKPFSWAPLGFDHMDDNDWSNWESPGPTKSPRWSDSTINSAGLEDIASIPEMREESTTPE